MNTKIRIISFSICVWLCLQICPLSQTQAAPQADKSASSAVQMTTGGVNASGKIVSAGETLGNDIDRLSAGISKITGQWINAEIFMGISWLKLLVCLVLLFLVVISERIMRYVMDRHIRSRFSEGQRLHAVVSLMDAMSKPLSLFILVYGSFWSFSPVLSSFKTSASFSVVYDVASKAADLVGYFAIAWFAYRFVSFMETHLMKMATKTESDLDDLLIPLIGKTLRIFVVMLAASVIIHNLTGLDLGPMLASLGIGGVAVAFAAKDSIANFLGSLTIIFDKPFTVGERISIDNYDGVVEEVGFRSTRIRTLSGHQVSIPNEKVVNTTVENIGRRPHIRWLTNITVTYDTPHDKVVRAVEIIEGILDNHEGMRPDYPPRVYFNGFNDWSLNIVVFAWYHPADYWKYQQWLQKTCLAILKAYNDEGIEFAFPTQTIFAANDSARQLKIEMLKGSGAAGVSYTKTETTLS